MYGLVNLTLFPMLINFLTALVGIQLIQGDMAGTVTMNFGQLFNSFLAVYQRELDHGTVQRNGRRAEPWSSSHPVYIFILLAPLCEL